VRESIARTRILDAIRDHVTERVGIERLRERVAEQLNAYTEQLATEISELREEKIEGLVDFIAKDERSPSS
jgi:hypothetical protein